MEPIQINALLLVEDDSASYALFVKAFDEFFEDNYDLKLFKGEEPLVAFLDELYSDPFAIEPSVILLKVKSGDEDRLGLLKKLKSNDKYKAYPVIVYCDSDNQDLVNECYDLHANAFIHQNPEEDIFSNSIQNLLNFWFTVILPPLSQQDY